jgi:hypothetical protein
MMGANDFVIPCLALRDYLATTTRSPHDELAASLMQTLEPPDWE